ncbi:unnamed protein product, partial [Adineta ricciae]
MRHVIVIPKQEKDVSIQTENMDMDDLEDDIIDLRTPVNEVGTLAVTLVDDLNHMSVAATHSQASYEPRTLRSDCKRNMVLPAFPAAGESELPFLLLANVPNHALGNEQYERRHSTKYRPPFHVIGGPPTSILVNTRIPSLFWSFYQELFRN